MNVNIQKAENGWILTHNSSTFTKAEVYRDEEELLLRVHQLISSKWSVGDKVSIIKDQS